MASTSYALKLAASLAVLPQLPDTFPASAARVQRKAETAPLSRLFVGTQLQLRHMFCMTRVALHTFRALTPSELTCRLACKLVPDSIAGLWHKMLMDENVEHRFQMTQYNAVVAANDVVADLHFDLSGLTCLRKVSLFPQTCVAPIFGLVLCVRASCVIEIPLQSRSSYFERAVLSSVAILRGQDQSCSIVVRQFMRLDSLHNPSAFYKRDLS